MSCKTSIKTNYHSQLSTISFTAPIDQPPNDEIKPQKFWKLVFLFTITVFSGLYILDHKQIKRKRRLMEVKIKQLEDELKFRKQEANTLADQLSRNKDTLERLKNSLKKAQSGTLADNDINNALLQIRHELKQQKQSNSIHQLLNNLQSEFYNRLAILCPNLTSNELKMLGMVRMGLSSKEIASLRNTSAKAVEMSRYRIRKKLHLEHKQHLIEFLEECV